MLEYKKRILFREFNFLPRVLEMCNLEGREPEDNCTKVEDVKIKKADEYLLAMCGACIEDNLHWSNNYAFVGKIYFAITGEEIYRIPSSTNCNGIYFAAGTVGEELLKANLIPDFIICVDAKQEKNFIYKANFGITIFKTKSFAMMEYHSAQFCLAAEQLIAEMKMANSGEFIGHTVRK